MLFFKSRKDKINEAKLSNVVKSLDNQLSGVVLVNELGGTDNIEDYKERIKDNFVWGYIHGFIWSFLNTIDVPIEKKNEYEENALNRLLPATGSRTMAEILEKKDETIMFGLGEEYAEEDFKNWEKTNIQPKKLGDFLIRGDKAINLDGID